MSIGPRRPTRVVRVGDLVIGGSHPILIQSMTVSDTLDTPRVVEEIVGLVEAGCPLVRVTVPHVKAAENLPAIKTALRLRGIEVPLVADIHFTPAAALLAAEHVAKVRINPGNYVDRKRFAIRTYTDAEYREEIDRIREQLTPLVLRLKKNGAALRIGTNHGSLSDRIMNRFGDTPEGMVESALEFVRICESLDYREIVLSMKSSIPSVMVGANRLLVRRMAEEGMDYPIHLGVTEAGGGIEGRVKSAIGIGALLLDGIGDTIRVSLTEDSVNEIDACRRILAAVESESDSPGGEWSPPAYPVEGRRRTHQIRMSGIEIGGDAPPRVEGLISRAPWDADGVGGSIEDAADLLQPSDLAAPRAVAELLRVSSAPTEQPSARLEPFSEFVEGVKSKLPDLPILIEFDLRSPGEIHALEPFLLWVDAVGAQVEKPEGRGRDRLGLLVRLTARRGKSLRMRIDTEGSVSSRGESRSSAYDAVALAETCIENGCESLSFLIGGPGLFHAARRVARALDAEESTRGIPLFLELPRDPMAAAVVGGGLLLNGIGDGLCIPGVGEPPAAGMSDRRGFSRSDLRGPGTDPVGVAYAILQACRLRLTRAEFIACPSCGRTQFDLQTTTRRIQQRTAHLSGVKIAIMGCVVNGPGEMADADFGYVGSAPGRVDLYVGRTRVRQAIPEEEADQRLIELIREHGKWIDPPSEGA